MFYYKIQPFHQDFKGENLFFKSILSSQSQYTGLVIRDHVRFSQMSNETHLHLFMRGHPFGTYAKFSEKLTFLTP